MYSLPVGRFGDGRPVALLVDRDRIRRAAAGMSFPRALRDSEMETHLARALMELNYEVSVVLARSGKQLMAVLEKVAPDVVFNTVEHLSGDYLLDAYVTAILEVLPLPYTGAAPGGLVPDPRQGVEQENRVEARSAGP